MSHTWDPAQYLRYADERARPFLDLTARIGAERPGLVVDLGAGPATQTRLLAERWPGAEVLAVDSSPAMVERARTQEGVTAVPGDLRTWEPPRPIDVLVTNAALQWVRGHLELLPRLAAMLAPGGWFAMQVPGNFEEPSHTLRRDLAAEAPFAEHLHGIASPASHDAGTYLHALQEAGLEVDAWETTYPTCCTARTPSSNGSAAPAPVPPWRHSRPHCASSSLTSSRRACARPIRTPGRAWCCRSGVSSPSAVGRRPAAER